MAMQDKIKELTDAQLADSILQVGTKGATSIEQAVLWGLMKEYEDRHGADSLDSFIEEHGIVPIFDSGG